MLSWILDFERKWCWFLRWCKWHIEFSSFISFVFPRNFFHSSLLLTAKSRENLFVRRRTICKIIVMKSSDHLINDWRLQTYPNYIQIRCFFLFVFNSTENDPVDVFLQGVLCLPFHVYAIMKLIVNHLFRT